MLGYVDVDYGTRPLIDVRTDIDAWRAYPVGGVFFDQVPSDRASLRLDDDAPRPPCAAASCSTPACARIPATPRSPTSCAPTRVRGRATAPRPPSRTGRTPRTSSTACRWPTSPRPPAGSTAASRTASSPIWPAPTLPRPARAAAHAGPGGRVTPRGAGTRSGGAGLAVVLAAGLALWSFRPSTVDGREAGRGHRHPTGQGAARDVPGASSPAVPGPVPGSAAAAGPVPAGGGGRGRASPGSGSCPARSTAASTPRSTTSTRCRPAPPTSPRCTPPGAR